MLERLYKGEYRAAQIVYIPSFVGDVWRRGPPTFETHLLVHQIADKYLLDGLKAAAISALANGEICYWLFEGRSRSLQH